MIFRPRPRFGKKEIARINFNIRVPEVRVISSTGEQLGVMLTKEAIEKAKDEGLDLVEIAPSAKPPVARIMDYGKFKYEKEQKAKLARKRQHIVEVKEIKFRPKISGGDYGTKKRHVERFLKAGSKVKVTIMFRGREMAHPELGRQILDRLSEDVAEYSVVEQTPKQDGRNMVMVLSSTIKPEKVSAEGAHPEEAAVRREEPGKKIEELTDKEEKPEEKKEEAKEKEEETKESQESTDAKKEDA